MRMLNGHIYVLTKTEDYVPGKRSPNSMMIMAFRMNSGKHKIMILHAPKDRSDPIWFEIASKFALSYVAAGQISNYQLGKRHIQRTINDIQNEGKIRIMWGGNLFSTSERLAAAPTPTP